MYLVEHTVFLAHHHTDVRRLHWHAPRRVAPHLRMSIVKHTRLQIALVFVLLLGALLLMIDRCAQKDQRALWMASLAGVSPHDPSEPLTQIPITVPNGFYEKLERLEEI